ncbi:unnamed protein product [Paramecium octaurelia]|uniref:Uncharacterized protein n=1 Tax=Paramecium octaurelia TaxID=43137 RepID=A0A8S1YKE0_PAROT|nr:unnamed protein product [Paramecium octaurelia]
MQKQEQSQLSTLQSFGDISPVPEEEDTEIKTIFTSPLTSKNSQRAYSFQYSQRIRKNLRFQNQLRNCILGIHIQLKSLLKVQQNFE